MANPLPKSLAVNPLIKQRRHHNPGPGRPFEKGQSGNPAGRPSGTRNAATRLAEAMLADAAPEITRATLERAYAGNDSLLKALFHKVTPARARTVALDLPEIATVADLVPALAAVTRAVAAGEITPYEAGELARLVETTLRVGELADFDRRLAALEREVEDAKQEDASRGYSDA